MLNIKYDIVGSFLRPAEIKEARAKFNNNVITYEQLRDVEDEQIAKLVAKEVQHGLKFVTDGEFRRRWWHLDWLKEFDGFTTENRPEDMQIATHFCKGNFKGNPLFHGFYDTIAKSVASIPYDGYFVEYDDARSGTFDPWAVLKGTDRTFVAGLISTKRPELEEHDAIKVRYEQAKAVVGDNIALSPQCGFASVEEGNCIDEETQWKKIDLLVSCQDFI